MVEVVGCPWDALWNHGSLAAKLLAPRSYALTRRCIAMAPFALYVTQRFLQRRYPCSGETIGCSDAAVDPPAESVLAQRLETIDGTRNGRPWTLGMVGSADVNYKGHDTALKALRLLARSGLNVRLRCLGGGDPSRWRARARALGVDGLVEFTGTLPHGPAVFAWMDALDVFVIPSLQEGLPRALVEAMSRGLPAVGARTGGIRELIGPEYIHPRRDPRRMAEILERLLVRRGEMRSCAMRNWEAAKAFSPDVLDVARSRFLERFRRYAESCPSGGTVPAVR
jgi:glycosyltransferase involved in cell wall biosynthesis